MLQGGNTMTESTQAVSRRSFLRTGALGAAASGLAAPAVLAQSPQVVRMQSAWPTSDIFQEMAQQYVDRVNKMSGDRLKIDLLPAGAVVGAFQVQDAVTDGALDAAHTVPPTGTASTKAASLFGTGPVFGGDGSAGARLVLPGRRQGLLPRAGAGHARAATIVGFFALPMPAQPLGWFKNEISDGADMKGLKYRTVGLPADLFQAMGVSVTQLPGGEIVPAMDRGVIDAFEFNNPTSDSRFGAQDVAKNYMLGSYHQASECFEIMFNQPSSIASIPTCRRSSSTRRRGGEHRQLRAGDAATTPRTCRS